VLQCVAVCCSVLREPFCALPIFSCILICSSTIPFAHTYVNGCVAVCSSVLQCVAVCCSVLQCVAVCCSVLLCVPVCCSVLKCVEGGFERCQPLLRRSPAHHQHLKFSSTHCNTTQHTATTPVVHTCVFIQTYTYTRHVTHDAHPHTNIRTYIHIYMHAYAQTYILDCVHTHHSCMHLQTHFGESHLYTHIYLLKKLQCCRLHNHYYAPTRAATCMRTSTHGTSLQAGSTHQSTQDRPNYTHHTPNKLNDSIC